MAAATAVVSRRSNDQFRGIFNETFVVTCTLDSASVVPNGAGSDTVAVPGVAFGDFVVAMSAGVSEQGLVRHAFVSAANTVTITTVNNTAAAIDLASTTIRLVIARLA